MHFVRAPDDLLGGFVQRAAGAGWIGVDLFFVLSGFLITGILIDTKGAAGYYRSFYARRLLRTLPLYYGIIAAILIIPRTAPMAQLLGAPYLAENQIWFWTHSVNWLMVIEGEAPLAVQSGFGAYWSLAIEEQFYLAWPIVVALVPFRHLARITIAIAVFAASLRISLAFAGVDAGRLYAATLTRLDPLAIGALLAVLVRSGGLQRFKLRYSLAVVLTAAVAGLTAYLGQATVNANAVAFASASAGLAIGWGAILLHTVLGAGRLSQLLEHSILRTLGKYSYGLYLFQAPVDHVLTQSGIGPRVIGGLAYGIVGTGVTFALAFASWHMWEKQWLGLKTRYPREAARLVVAP